MNEARKGQIAYKYLIHLAQKGEDFCLALRDLLPKLGATPAEVEELTRELLAANIQGDAVRIVNEVFSGKPDQ